MPVPLRMHRGPRARVTLVGVQLRVHLRPCDVRVVRSLVHVHCPPRRDALQGAAAGDERALLSGGDAKGGVDELDHLPVKSYTVTRKVYVKSCEAIHESHTRSHTKAYKSHTHTRVIQRHASHTRNIQESYKSHTRAIQEACKSITGDRLPMTCSRGVFV